MIDFGLPDNYSQSAMKFRLRRISWIIGILGLLGILLQSLQVQIEHEHSGGESAHSHSHGHSHAHSHGHSHSHSHHSHSHGHSHHQHTHSSPSKTKVARAPEKHAHVTLLWWEFTIHLPAASAASDAPAQIAEEGQETKTESMAGHSASTHQGPVMLAVPWERLISEWFSSWVSVFPPQRHRLPARQIQLTSRSPAEACYQCLRDAPPVPPPQLPLSDAIS